MNTNVLNYRVIIEPEIYPNGQKVYNAYCPTLDVADYGDSIEEVLESIQAGIELALESKAKEGKEIPVDDLAKQIVTSAQVNNSAKYRLAI